MRFAGEAPPPGAVSCGVILAAGEGRRLSTVHGVPKPATEILGLSLGERVMLACLGAGVDRFVIVLGAQAETVRAHFERVAARRGCAVDFVTAADWPLGNGVSTLAARDLVEDARFLLVMADHLVSASLIQQVLRGPLGPGDVGLGVDHDTAGLFDLDDAMKVDIDEGRVRRIGKQLRTWNAVDTGVFLATPALFDALEDAGQRGRYGLCDGIESLAEDGRVQAIDVTGEPWIDVDTPAALREARRRLLQSLGKPGADGYVAAHLNRRLSVPISARLAQTPVTPTQITVVSFLIALGGAACFAVGGHWTAVIGALLVQLSSVVDGCDGELARLRHLATARGGWLDTMLDRYADAAVVVGITLGYAAGHAGVLPWLGGMAASTGFLLASYTTKEYALSHGTAYPNDWLNRLKRRDLRLFVIACGGLIGYPYYAMVAMGALSHLVIMGILATGWRSPQMGPGMSRRSHRPAVTPASTPRHRVDSPDPAVSKVS
ncbi:MAG: NTP transferase domain-containing protein [Vicinamibacterales bacterium]